MGTNSKIDPRIFLSPMATAEENQSSWAAYLHRKIATLRFPSNERFRESFVEVIPSILNHVEGDDTWETHLEDKVFNIKLKDEIHIDSPFGEEDVPMRIALLISYTVCLVSKRVVFEARLSKGGDDSAALITLRTDSSDAEWIATNVVARQYIKDYNQAHRTFRRLRLRDN